MENRQSSDSADQPASLLTLAGGLSWMAYHHDLYLVLRTSAILSVSDLEYRNGIRRRVAPPYRHPSIDEDVH